MEKVENRLSRQIVDTCFKIHTHWDPGYLNQYMKRFFYELQKHGFSVQRQQGIPVEWEEVKMNLGFRADLIVENKVLIELKSVENLARVHFKQLLTYLKLTNLKLGLLINFNDKLIKDGINRVVNGL